ENEDEIPPLEDFVDMDDEDGEFGQDEIDNNESDEDASGEIELTRFALTKIRGLSFAIIHSPTIGLPEWRRVCEAHHLRHRLLPRDVRTRWNSTYDMLEFAVRYRAAIDDI
ncbi:hypothetical protein K435DRAFT_624054, partial [Dendrothele bispora CBS 962.96]